MNGVAPMLPERFEALVRAKCNAKGHVVDGETPACARCGAVLADLVATETPTVPATPKAKKKREKRVRIDKAPADAPKEPIIEVPPDDEPPKASRGKILGIDPGFSSIGYVVLDVLGKGRLAIETMGVFRTKPTAKKRRGLAIEDNLRRANEISRELLRLAGPDVIAVCAEAMSFPRNASAAAKVAMTWGILSCISVLRNVPIFQAMPQEVKVGACGVKTASKEEVEAAMRVRYRAANTHSKNIPATLREHCFDALAAAHFCANEGVLQMARKVT